MSKPVSKQEPVVLSFQVGGIKLANSGEGGMAVAMLMHDGSRESLLTLQFVNEAFFGLVTAMNAAAFKHDQARVAYDAIQAVYTADPSRALASIPASNPFAVYQRRKAEAQLRKVYCESLLPESVVVHRVFDLYQDALSLKVRTQGNQTYSLVIPLMTLFRLQDIADNLIDVLALQDTIEEDLDQ